MKDYSDFLSDKTHAGADHGFEPMFIPDALFDFQKHLVAWHVRTGRSAGFADCGLGKTAMQLTVAENIRRKTNKPVLVLTPLAVAAQTVREGEKFGIECTRSTDGSVYPVTVANYERLHHFSAADFAGVVCDESSILKSFDGSRRSEITEFMRKIPYRLLSTATAAPNDYVELGTSSEALGYLGHMDMLNRFFKNDQNNSSTGRIYGEVTKWRFKGHAEIPFWRWVTSWARALRKPSDMGFDDGPLVLPALHEIRHIVETDTKPDGMLFSLAAVNLREQREEKKRTVKERCEKAAALVADTGEPALLWCHLNDEGDYLEQIIPGAIQVSGADSDDAKEEKFLAFSSGESRVLVTKPKVGAWGMNWQHCNRVVYFPSHSYEQYYQAVRRCWRFGQKRPVTVDIVMTEGEKKIMANLARKSIQAEEMFGRLVAEMNNAIGIKRENMFTQQEIIPSWL